MQNAKWHSFLKRQQAKPALALLGIQIIRHQSSSVNGRFWQSYRFAGAIKLIQVESIFKFLCILAVLSSHVGLLSQKLSNYCL